MEERWRRKGLCGRETKVLGANDEGVKGWKSLYVYSPLVYSYLQYTCGVCWITGEIGEDSTR